MVLGVVNAGDMLMLLIPRDDFAKLMDFMARIEMAPQGPRGNVLGEEINFSREDAETLSRIAADLTQQVDALDQS